MSIKVYTTDCFKGFEIIDALDDKGIDYEICKPTTEWVSLNKVKNLPVMEVNGKILDYRKAMKYIKRIKE